MPGGDEIGDAVEVVAEAGGHVVFLQQDLALFVKEAQASAVGNFSPDGAVFDDTNGLVEAIIGGADLHPGLSLMADRFCQRPVLGGKAPVFGGADPETVFAPALYTDRLVTAAVNEDAVFSGKILLHDGCLLL